MKLFLYLFIVFAPFTCIAQTMCVRDTSLVISLDPTVEGTAYNFNKSESVWWVDFPYGRIYGEGTCLSAEEGLGRTSERGAYYGVDKYANTTITAESGLKGVDVNGNERIYCWCRTTHPISSAWVFEGGYTSSAQCEQMCAGNAWRGCYVFSGASTGNSIRKGAFSSIGHK